MGAKTKLWHDQKVEQVRELWFENFLGWHREFVQIHYRNRRVKYPKIRVTESSSCLKGTCVWSGCTAVNVYFTAILLTPCILKFPLPYISFTESTLEQGLTLVGQLGTFQTCSCPSLHTQQGIQTFTSHSSQINWENSKHARSSGTFQNMLWQKSWKTVFGF